MVVGYAGKETVQDFVGIASSQMDISSRVASFQSFYFYFEEEISGRYFDFFIRKFCYGVNTTGTSDKDFPFILRVEIQKDISAHKTFFQGKCSGQSGFFIYGEQTFQRSVFYAVIGKDSQLRSHTDTIVSSECSSFGFQPFTVYFCFDWIGEEVVLNIIVFLTYHVNVRLQYYSLQVFLSGSGRLFNQYVARFVHFGLKIIFSSERL